MEAAFYQSECNKRGVRIYPISDYTMYLLEMEFNKTPAFSSMHVQALVRGDTRYDPRKNEWANKITAKYKQIYETRILPRLEKGKEVKAGTIRAVYRRNGSAV